MASVIAILRTEQLEVEPGDAVSSVVTVHNMSPIVEQFTMTVVGEAAEWASVEPPTLSLFPNTQQDVTVTFAPPREWHIPPGYMPFAVRVSPQNAPDDSVAEEGMLHILAYQDLSAELIPAVAMGKRRGKLGLVVDSKSNVTIPAVIRGRDPSDTLVISVKPRQLTLRPGTATFAKLKVVPRKRYLRGPQKQSRFKISVEPEDADPILLDATMIQQAILPKGSFAGLAVLAALALWFIVIRPQVKNAAVDAVLPQVKATQKQAVSVSKQLASTNSKVSAVQQSVHKVAKEQAKTATTTSTTTTTSPTTTTIASSSSSSATTTTTSTTTTTTLPAAASGPQLTPGPYSNAIEVVAAPGQNQQGTFVIPKGNSLDVTDVIIENLTEVNGSTVQVGLELPGGSPHYFFEMSLSQLTSEDFPLQTPLVLSEGDTLVINVSCAGASTSTSACAANVYYGGTAQLSSS